MTLKALHHNYIEGWDRKVVQQITNNLNLTRSSTFLLKSNGKIASAGFVNTERLIEIHQIITSTYTQCN